MGERRQPAPSLHRRHQHRAPHKATGVQFAGQHAACPGDQVDRRPCPSLAPAAAAAAPRMRAHDARQRAPAAGCPGCRDCSAGAQLAGLQAPRGRARKRRDTSAVKGELVTVKGAASAGRRQHGQMHRAAVLVQGAPPGPGCAVVYGTQRGSAQQQHARRLGGGTPLTRSRRAASALGIPSSPHPPAGCASAAPCGRAGGGADHRPVGGRRVGGRRVGGRCAQERRRRADISWRTPLTRTHAPRQAARPAASAAG